MTLEIVPAAIGDKSVLRQLIELYQYDWSDISPYSEYTGGKYQETMLAAESWAGPAQSFDNREGSLPRSQSTS